MTNICHIHKVRVGKIYISSFTINNAIYKLCRINKKYLHKFMAHFVWRETITCAIGIAKHEHLKFQNIPSKNLMNPFMPLAQVY
jgi:hypothetical protein